MCVAANDVDYNQHPNKQAFEHQWLHQASRGNIHQGIFVASASGNAYRLVSTGWPAPDPIQTLDKMKKALTEIKAQGEAAKLSRSLDPAKDKLKWESEAFTKPTGTLDLRISTRGYKFAGMTATDQRNPDFYHLDRLWFKPSEWREFLPTKLNVGATRPVEGVAKTRWVMLSHMQAGHSAWWIEHIRSSTMTSRVANIEGQLVKLEISGSYQMKADSQWCRDTYDGEILIHATFDTSKQQWQRFEACLLGTHTVGQMMSNIHAGSPTQRIAAYATINPGSDPDDQMIPYAWKHGYGLNWSRTP